MAIVCPAPKSLLLEPIVCRYVVGGKAIQNNRTAAAYLGRLCMALTGPCFVFLFGSEGVVFSVLCVHARTVVVVLKSENLILFFGQKKERDGRTARVWRTDDWPCAEEKVVVRCFFFCVVVVVVVVCRLRLAFNIDALLFLLILLLPPIRKWATTNKKERIWFFFYRRLSLND